MANISQINGLLINAATASLATTASFALAVAGGGGAAFPFTGSARITGSLIVTGSTNISGSLTATSITSSFTGSLTGALIGTSSWANSASQATQAATTLVARIDADAPYYLATVNSLNSTPAFEILYSPPGITINPASGSLNATSITSSFTGSLTGALIGTASWATRALTASLLLGSVETASYAFNAVSAVSADSAKTVLTVSSSVNSVFYPTFVDSDNAPGSNEFLFTSDRITFNPGLQTLTVRGLLAQSMRITSSLTVTGSTNFVGSTTGSIFSGSSFTGSLFGTSSWAQSASNAISASWAPGGGSTFPFTGNAVISGSLVVTASTGATYAVDAQGDIKSADRYYMGDTTKYFSGATGQPLYIRTVGNSISFNNGAASNTVMGRFQTTTGNFTLQGGPVVDDNGYKFQIHQTGSQAGANGAMWVSGSSVFSGSITVPVGGITGSLLGTSSFSSNTFTNLKTVRLEMGVSSTTAITTGAKGRKTVSFNGTIVGWRLVAGQSTTTTVDIWKSNLAIPTVANTITAAAKPALTAAQLAGSTTLTGWTTSVADGDVFILNVDSNNNATYICLELDIVLTNA